MNLEAKMYCHGFWVGSGKASKIDNNGVCLQIKEPVSISTRHAYLEVELSLLSKIGEESYRLPVYVNSVNGDKMKLSFVDYDQDTLARLRVHVRAIEAGLHAQVA